MLNIDVSKQIDAESGSSLLRADVQIETNTITGIYGGSGQGKSTLFNMIAGVLKPDKGTISFSDVIWNNSEIHIPIQKRKIGYIFQGNSLFPHFTVKQNILYAVPKKEHKTFDISTLLEQMSLTHLSDKYPNQLSGGQVQRVAIARTLAQKAKLILMDEPFTGLDMEIKHRLYKEIKKIQESSGLTILVITHNVSDITYLCDKVYWMENHTLRSAITSEQFKNEIEKRIKNL